MRKILIIAIALVAVCLQGCIVKSVYPFFKEEDVVYRKEFVGSWLDEDKNRWEIHQNVYKLNSYELHCAKNGREAALLGHLFTINGSLYLDIMPIADNSEELLVFDLHMVPTHSIAKVELRGNDEINIRWFNEEWLREMFVQNKIRISHEMIMDARPKSNEDGMYLLTATTDELQKFIAKYGGSEEAFKKGDSEMKLDLRRTGP
ncbi:MAG TPA: hypothetical protein VK508_05200 [Cyclobacteriaceae bacterium]|nr:hypothetical protein [Cyclobacteriaceae bacterium]